MRYARNTTQRPRPNASSAASIPTSTLSTENDDDDENEIVAAAAEEIDKIELESPDEDIPEFEKRLVDLITSHDK